LPDSPTSLTPAELLDHVQWVRRLAASLLASGADPDDVAQETWLRALRRPPADQGRLRPWLAAVARNVARQLRRGHERRVEHEQRAPAPSPAASAAELIDRTRLQRRVVDAVLALDEPYRATLLRRYFEDEMPAAIARRDGVPVDTVKTRLKRGLAQLREKLADDRSSLALWLGLPAGPSIADAPPIASRGPSDAIPGPWSLIVASKSGVIAVAAALLGVGAIVWQVAAPEAETGALGRSVVDLAAAPPDEPLLAPVEAQRATESAAARAGDAAPSAPSAAVGDSSPAAAAESLSGFVVDHRGAAVAGATVVVGRERDPALRSLATALRASESLARSAMIGDWPRRVTTTDEVGLFRFDDLAALAPDLRALALFAVEPDVGVALLAGLPLDAQRTPDGLCVELMRGTRVTGRITDGEGRPLEGARVEIDGFDPTEPDFVPGGWTAAELVAGNDGSYRTIALPFAAFELAAEPAGSIRDRRWSAARSPRVAAPPGATEVRIDLALPAVRVVRGALRSADGRPLAEALARRFRPEQLARSDQEQFGVFGYSQDPRPSFGLIESGPEPMWLTILLGSYDVAAERYELPVTTYRCTCVAIVARKRLLAFAPLPADERGPDLVLDIDSILPAIPPARVRIRVVADDGSIPSGVRVYADVVSRDGRMTMSQGAAADLDAEGLAQLEERAGEWTLIVEGAGGFSDRVTLWTRPGDALDCTLRWTAARGKWRGCVVDARDQPIAGARVHLVRRSGERWVGISGEDVLTDRAGGFELPWIDGEARIVAQHDEFAPSVGALPATHGIDGAPIVLERGVAVTLRAVDRAGGDVGTARLRILASDGLPLIDDLDENGPGFRDLQSRVVRLHPGDYRIETWAVGYAPNDAPLAAIEGASLTLALERLDAGEK